MTPGLKPSPEELEDAWKESMFDRTVSMAQEHLTSLLASVHSRPAVLEEIARTAVRYKALLESLGDTQTPSKSTRGYGAERETAGVQMMASLGATLQEMQRPALISSTLAAIRELQEAGVPEEELASLRAQLQTLLSGGGRTALTAAVAPAGDYLETGLNGPTPIAVAPDQIRENSLVLDEIDAADLAADTDAMDVYDAFEGTGMLNDQGEFR